MEQIDLKKLEAVITGKDASKILEVYSYLKIYKEDTKRAEWLTRRDKCWGIIENDKESWWTGEELDEIRRQKQEPNVTNKCVKGVQGKAAIVTDQKPEIKFFPIGSSDLYIAELLKRGHDTVWTKNEGNDVTYDGVEETQVGGISFLKVRHDPSKGPFGRILFEEAPPEDFYWDRNARQKDLSDTHIIEAKLRSKPYIKEHYGDILDEEDLNFKIELKEETDATSSGITGADNYAEGEKDKLDSDSTAQSEPENIWEIDAWMLKTGDEDWVVRPGPDGLPQAEPIELDKEKKKDLKAGDAIEDGVYWPRKLEKRIHRFIIGKKLIEEQENPHGMDADGNPVLPVIAIRAQRTRNSYPMSPTAYAKDPNRQLNKATLQFAHAIAHLANAPIVRPAQGTKWKGEPGTPGSELLVSQTSAFTPQRLQAGSIDANKFLEIRQMAEADINDMYDIHDVMRGKVPEGTDPSGRVVLALQDMGGMMSKPFLRVLEAALIRLAKVNIAMILKYWPRYMWERLLEEDEWRKWMPDEEKAKLGEEMEEPDEEMQEKIQRKWEDALEKIRPADASKPPGISLIDLDVKLTAGSSLPTNRIAKAQLAMEYVEAGIYDAEAALEYVDDPNKDKIAARMKKKEEMMMQAGALKK